MNLPWYLAHDWEWNEDRTHLHVQGDPRTIIFAAEAVQGEDCCSRHCCPTVEITTGCKIPIAEDDPVFPAIEAVPALVRAAIEAHRELQDWVKAISRSHIIDVTTKLAIEHLADAIEAATGKRP